MTNDRLSNESILQTFQEAAAAQEELMNTVAKMTESLSLMSQRLDLLQKKVDALERRLARGRR